MNHHIAYFFGGVFFVNAVPNLMQGMSGRALPHRFAKFQSVSFKD
jgi:hypothetical protein